MDPLNTLKRAQCEFLFGFSCSPGFRLTLNKHEIIVIYDNKQKTLGSANKRNRKISQLNVIRKNIHSIEWSPEHQYTILMIPSNRN